MSDGDGFQILAVCSGNVCRSPLVELLLRDRLAGEAQMSVASAGTIARPGQSMTVEMVNVAARYGVPATRAAEHTAARLTEDDVARADLILGLTREHRAEALRLHPAAVKRAFTLTEFARLIGRVEAHAGIPSMSGELVVAAGAHRGARVADLAESDDIDDPIGMSQEIYDRVGAQITAAVNTIAHALLRTRPGRSPHSAVAAGPTSEPKLDFSFRRR